MVLGLTERGVHIVFVKNMFRSKSAGLGSLKNELYTGNRRRETMSESEMQAELSAYGLRMPNSRAKTRAASL